jgi:OmpA-OmpF porin, OOP family
VSGTYADEAGRAALAEVAAALGADVAVTERPAATDDDASELEAELNAFVGANPILFEPSSSVLDESAAPILDEVARRANQLAGVTITVEGHTDSDGGAQENLILSQLRALAVQQALVERGLDPASVTSEGFGSQRPIVVDGVEDKDASRRVEFRVVVT